MVQGTLYIIATPIGNLEDITLRALRLLKEVDLIAAEDTRRSKILLNHYNIKTALISLHQHNEKERSIGIIARIKDGMNVAYISDAGTPCISDPGYYLVNYALENDVTVVSVPGPSALVAALAVSGFPADQFVFYGFLPSKGNKRHLFLETIRNEEKTIIFYESPMRIKDLLTDIYTLLGDRQVVVAREITKVFEEIRRGKVSEVMSVPAVGRTKGEFTVIVQGAVQEADSPSDEDIRRKLLQIWEEGSVSLKDAVADAAKEMQQPRKKIYDIAVKIRREP